jgi:hypothetical protein
MVKLTQRHVDICWAMYHANMTLAHGNDDQRRQLNRKIAEQYRFEFGDRWGTKSTTINHPQSKDALAYLLDNGLINIWDWQNGTSRQPQITAGQGPHYENMDQYFIEVPPVNHLNSNPNPNPTPEPEPEPEPPSTIEDKLNEILEENKVIKDVLTGILDVLKNMDGHINSLENNINLIKNNQNPPYRGGVPMFGGTSTLYPVDKP